MFIPDPGSEFFPSRIPDPNFFYPGSRIRIKEFKYFNPKNWFLSSRKYDPGCSSWIKIRNTVINAEKCTGTNVPVLTLILNLYEICTYPTKISLDKLYGTK